MNFELMVWGGTLLTLFGILGILYSILFVVRARRQNPEQDIVVQNTLKSAVLFNLSALFLSFMGLVLVLLGIFFK
ncbi:MAG: hypothetical protein OXC68_05415 [Aestuariivita sp.]|nr:hypothetical protein [Aestuariivita sp.]